MLPERLYATKNRTWPPLSHHKLHSRVEHSFSMKVLLVQAYLGGNEPPVFPLGLACIAASIPHHETKIFDSNTVTNPFETLRELAIDFNPDIVGISLRNIDSTNKSTVVFYYAWLKDLIAAIQAGCSAKITLGAVSYTHLTLPTIERCRSRW